MKPRSYQDLTVWQKVMVVTEQVYELTGTFPREEQYGLVAQMRRSAVSVPSNIAEGTMRSSRKDFRQFVLIASGSVAELETQLELSYRLGYLTEGPYQDIRALVGEIGKMLNRLASRLANPPLSTSN